MSVTKTSKKAIKEMSGFVEVSLLELREIRFTQDTKLSAIKGVVGACDKTFLCQNGVGFSYFPNCGVTKFFFVSSVEEVEQKIEALKKIGIKGLYMTSSKNGHNYQFLVIPCQQSICSTADHTSGLKNMFGYSFYAA